MYDRCMNGVLQAQMGFAADDRGNGVAYVRLRSRRGERVLRVPFTVRRLPALLGREIGYAALAAVLPQLAARGVEALQLVLEDETLAADLRDRRDLPPALAMPYVRARCALNRLRRSDIAPAAPEGDLTARARSEAALHAAA